MNEPGSSPPTEPTVASRLFVSTSRRFVEHETGPGHPERPERIRALWRSLEDEPVAPTEWSEPSAAEREQCARVHRDAHLDLLDETRGTRVRFDADTVASPGSVDAAYLAAGAAIGAARAAVRRQHDLALALVRPPGHHAEADRAMGFCLLNNVAIAAEEALQAPEIERVLIVDWDVHHGNGTQHHFEDRRDVLFWSSHRGGGFYPGTGRLQETGRGEGEGFTVNAPLPGGAGDGLICAVHEEVLLPIAEAFDPNLVLVSAGYDAHLRDPLGGLQVTDGGFARLGAVVRRIAHRHAEGRLAFVLEGGYDLIGLTGGLRASIGGALGDDTPPPPALNERERELVSALRSAHGESWPVLAS